VFVEQRFDWPDIGFTGMADVRDYVVVWRILDIVGADDSGQVIGWWKREEVNPWPCAEDPAEAEVQVEIAVKWDGCANYSWPSHIATHTCDGGKALTQLILRVHELTKNLLGDKALPLP
jgi:hypothetical protein